MYPLPPNARPIAYLESTGTQYVDTGVVGAKNLRVEIDAYNNPDGPGTYCTVFGARASSTSEQFDVWWFALSWGTASQRNAVRYDYGTNTTSPDQTRTFSSAIMTRSTIAIADGVLTVAGQNLTPTYLSQSPASGLTNYLFAINTAGTASLGNNPIRVYSCKIYDSATLVRDFVPCRIGSTGYLFDRVSGQLFGNQGTGDFVTGPYTDRVPLPSYARRVEYLESTGSQWIDTELGYFPEFEIGAVVPGAVGNNTLGINQSWKLGRHSADEPVWRASLNNRSYITSVSCGTYADMSYHGTTFKCNSDTITVPANQYVSGTMVLFSAGVALPSAYPLKLYYCRLFDRNGNLVRSFIPCRVNGIGYLWDEVNGRFHENKGTGEFVLGQDVRECSIPSKLNPMGVARRLDPVPYDAELEYLEATGTQWISTPLKISSQGRLQVDASFNSWTGANDTLWCARYIGSTSSDIRNALALFKLQNGTLGWDVRPTGSTLRITVTYEGDSNRHSYKQEAGVLYIDGTQVATTTETISESGGTLYFFVSNFTNGTMATPTSGRLYSAEYWDANGNLILKLVPVKKNGVGYMFDRVSGQFFGNAGTGSFGLGPVKGYVQDGLVMQLDGFYNEDTQRHNGSATVWKDLAGSRNVTLTRASNGWNKDSLNTKVVTGGATATIATGTFPGIHYSPGTTVEMVYKVDTAQNANGEVLTFVGGYERMAISHVSGGTAGELFIASAPDTRIGVDMTSPDIDQDLTTREIIQQIAVVFGQSNDVTGWAIYHKSNPQPIYNRGGSLGTQTDGTGTIMGRVSSSPDNAAGVVYALRIYNRALTQEEVKHNWELDKARFNIS